MSAGRRPVQHVPPCGTVWAALNDAEFLKASIPGCEEIERVSPTEMKAVVVQKVGPVKATFHGEVELSDIVEGQSYRISGRGKGGAAGGATVGANVRLEEVPEGTRLSYEVEAKVTGKIAQLVARLIDGFAKKLADQFFERFQQTVEGPAPEEEDEIADGTPAGGKKDWLGRLAGGSTATPPLPRGSAPGAGSRHSGWTISCRPTGAWS